METSSSRRCFRCRRPASRASTPAPRPPPWRRGEQRVVSETTVLLLLLLQAHSLRRPQQGTKKARRPIAPAIEPEERRARRR